MPPGPETPAAASAKDIKAVLGSLDENDLLEIVGLGPSLRDLEEAVSWLSGDRDIFGPGEPLKGIAAEIVAVLTPDEDDETRAR